MLKWDHHWSNIIEWYIEYINIDRRFGNKVTILIRIIFFYSFDSSEEQFFSYSAKLDNNICETWKFWKQMQLLHKSTMEDKDEIYVGRSQQDQQDRGWSS